MSGLRVIEGGSKPRSYHRQTTQQVVCRVCEAELGVASSLGVWAVQSPMRRAGKVTGGTKVLVCLPCLARGKETLL